jgi:hypothetical protein
MGRLSNPPEIAETPVGQGPETIVGESEGVETPRIRRFDDLFEGPREERGRLSNPPQRRLSPSDIDDLVEAYRAGAGISRLAAKWGVHRTTVAGHLDRRKIPRHHERSAWDDDALASAAEMYAAGLSLADVGAQFRIDAQTVANRFRRAGVPVRPRRGWRPRNQSERIGP